MFNLDKSHDLKNKMSWKNIAKPNYQKNIFVYWNQENKHSLS